MRHPNRRINLAVLIAMLFAVEAPADAYLDPGTGSMIVQAALGAVAAAIVAVRVYWSELRRWVTRDPPRRS